MNENSVLLCSGGMDSTTLAYWMIEKHIDFIPLFINYGQHCLHTEVTTLLEVIPNKLKERIQIINISQVYRDSKSCLIKEPDLWNDVITDKDFFLPYRNLLLMTVGAAFAQSNNCSFLYAAFINSNHAKEIDCSTRFFKDLSEVLKDYGTVNIKLPFRDLSKFEVAKLGILLKAPIGKTFSCQASAVVPCGACPNCVDRLDALKHFTSNN
ncbi:MAG TPA: 7-cyano-7-deazaguanine synthase [Bacteroidetes bacterium]|nr:7-cyano-7-deazaguanine synthase [Bacteroidota bacterium]